MPSSVELQAENQSGDATLPDDLLLSATELLNSGGRFFKDQLNSTETVHQSYYPSSLETSQVAESPLLGDVLSFLQQTPQKESVDQDFWTALDLFGHEDKQSAEKNELSFEDRFDDPPLKRESSTTSELPGYGVVTHREENIDHHEDHRKNSVPQKGDQRHDDHTEFESFWPESVSGRNDSFWDTKDPKCVALDSDLIGKELTSTTEVLGDGPRMRRSSI